ncbi:acyltransferase family protein [Novosphingobium colocasiae]|uniref:acyltransferase family protein n=1 Tax=Novosphingobium colocasiae TaxID=1256513 RepID=UPI0035B22DFB
MSTEPGAGAGRERYIALDAIRGAAALAVLFYHLRNLKPDGITQPDGAEGAMFASGYLAVDLFFVMSGFVIAHAYGHRLGAALPPGRFLALRFVRLQPVMAIGVLIGFGFALVQRLAGLPDAPGLFAIATSLPFNLAMLPNLLLPWSLFLFNAPAWSLFFELAANAGYGVLFARARPIALRVCAGTCMGGLIGLVIAGWQIGDLDHGVDLIHWPVALVRIGFSFPLGVLLYHARGRWARHVPRLPVWLLLAACVAALAPSPQGAWRSLYDIGFATVLSPLLVMLGAVARPGSRSLAAASWLGLISYPLYALHAPIKHIVEAAVPLGFAGLYWTATVAALIAAHVVATRVDEPARAMLRRLLDRLLQSRPATASARRGAQP